MQKKTKLNFFDQTKPGELALSFLLASWGQLNPWILKNFFQRPSHQPSKRGCVVQGRTILGARALVYPFFVHTIHNPIIIRERVESSRVVVDPIDRQGERPSVHNDWEWTWACNVWSSRTDGPRTILMTESFALRTFACTQRGNLTVEALPCFGPVWKRIVFCLKLFQSVICWIDDLIQCETRAESASASGLICAHLVSALHSSMVNGITHHLDRKDRARAFLVHSVLKKEENLIWKKSKSWFGSRTHWCAHKSIGWMVWE